MESGLMLGFVCWDAAADNTLGYRLSRCRVEVAVSRATGRGGALTTLPYLLLPSYLLLYLLTRIPGVLAAAQLEHT